MILVCWSCDGNFKEQSWFRSVEEVKKKSSEEKADEVASSGDTHKGMFLYNSCLRVIHVLINEFLKKCEVNVLGILPSVQR